MVDQVGIQSVHRLGGAARPLEDRLDDRARLGLGFEAQMRCHHLEGGLNRLIARLLRRAAPANLFCHAFK